MAAWNAGISLNTTPTVTENPMAIGTTQIGAPMSWDEVGYRPTISSARRPAP